LTVVMEPIERRAGADLGVTVQITAEGVVDEGSSGLPSEGNQSEEGDDHGS
jgi:hypothetical protein